MKKKKIIFSVLVCIVLFVTSFGMVSSYDQMEKVIDKDDKIDDIERTLIYGSDFLWESNLALSYDLDKLNGSPIPFEEKFLIFKDIKETNTVSKTDAIKSIENNTFMRFEKQLKNEPNVEYYAIDKTSGKSATNSKNDLTVLGVGGSANISNEYKWYIKCDYDENGVLTTSGKNNVNQVLESDFSNRNNPVYTDVNEIGDVTFTVDLNYSKNLSVTYAVPNKMVSNGQLYTELNNYSALKLAGIMLCYTLLFFLVISLFIMFYPIVIMKECNPFKSLAKIKLEILCIPFIFGIITGTVFPGYMVMSISNGDFKTLFTEIGMGNISDALTFIISIGFWILIFGLSMFGVFLIKYIFNKGLIKYIKENTIIGWIFRNSHKAVDKILSFDINEVGNRAILKIVLVNFAIITIISFLFRFGFFVSIIYTIILFALLKNKFIEIRENYGVLLKATKKLSNGEFNVEIHEDLGMFNSLRDEFTNIKEGFEKVVHEEVKSQRMKTELVSNVSHDLKTPLTSIITYVDLLKKEDSSEEERKKYIDTIDRNSLRLKNLIEDLFEVSKANSGNVSLNIVDVDIVALIKQAQFECLDKIQEMNLDFKVNYSQEKIVYALDSSKTYRVFENLLINICKYSLPHTRVYVYVIEKENEVEITFRNISANEINFDTEDIVERFARGDKSRNSDGSGLGLAIAKSFTELQNGIFNIEVDGDLFKAIIIFKK